MLLKWLTGAYRVDAYAFTNQLSGHWSWRAAIHGVAKSQTGLSGFTFTFHFHALEKEMATHSSVLAWRIPGMGDKLWSLASYCIAPSSQRGGAVRRVAQEVQRFAQESGHDASRIPLALGRAASYPRLCQALGAMLSKGALNSRSQKSLSCPQQSLGPVWVGFKGC